MFNYQSGPDRDILIEALREEYREPTKEQIVRLDADLTKIAHILFQYFIEQRNADRKIADPHPESDELNQNGSNTSGVCG